jgi:hypothetical protein
MTPAACVMDRRWLPGPPRIRYDVPTRSEYRTFLITDIVDNLSSYSHSPFVIISTWLGYGLDRVSIPDKGTDGIISLSPPC